MSPRLRLLLSAAGIATLTTAITLVFLTLLDRRLDLPSVLHFDLLWQARIHSLASPLLTHVMVAFTWIGSIKIFATALTIALIYLALRDGLHDAILLFTAIAGAFILNETLKLHFHRMRPQVPWSIGDEHTYSFPSGHSLSSVVFYGTLAWCAIHRRHGRLTPRRRMAILTPALVMPIFIGLSRIYLGMHYPTDVLAGWTTGALWLSAIVASDILHHRQHHQNDPPL